MHKAIPFYLISLLSGFFSFAQTPATPVDTTRIIEIIDGRSLREKTLDSVTKIETIAGNAVIKEGLTKFYCDSAIINRKLNTIEAFGNVHINNADSVHSYSQYLKYYGNDRLAYLNKDVRLTDNKGTLFTNELEYDLKTGIGKYHNGGKVVNGKTVLTSNDGFYYSDTKDVYFKNNVYLKDPKYTTIADSLLYNTQTQVVTLIGPTHSKSKDADIYSTQGTYDLKTGNATFGSRSLIKDSSGRTYQANNMALDDKSGIAQLEGNAIIKDSANGTIVTGNQIFLNKNNNSFLATRKPVLIIEREKDSTYIAADTLFSGYSDRLTAAVDTSETKSIETDSLKIVPRPDSVKAFDSSNAEHKNFITQKDSLEIDSSKLLSFKIDSVKKVTNIDSTTLNPQKNDTIKTVLATMDSLGKAHPVNLNKSDTAIRYFLAFHHVRIFNDSLQSVCDSLYYSTEDSIFRLFSDPIVWNGESQLTGDTIYLFTKNKKADRLYVFENGIMINKSKNDFYNQIAGKTINGYFKNGSIDYARVKGSPAESVYYVQDKDSAYVGMNRASSDAIDMYFIKDELDKVKFINDVHGIMHPIRSIPEDQKLLKNFNWQDKRRPKTKLELFE